MMDPIYVIENASNQRIWNGQHPRLTGTQICRYLTLMVMLMVAIIMLTYSSMELFYMVKYLFRERTPILRTKT